MHIYLPPLFPSPLYSPGISAGGDFEKSHISLQKNCGGDFEKVYKDSLIYGIGMVKVSYDDTTGEIGWKNIGDISEKIPGGIVK